MASCAANTPRLAPLRAAAPRTFNPHDTAMPNRNDSGLPNLEFQMLMLILAEKRTAHTTLRSGLSLCAFQLAILSFLVATSPYYDVASNVILLSLIGVMCTGLIGLGLYLLRRGWVRILFHDKQMSKILERNPMLAELFYHKSRMEKLG